MAAELGQWKECRLVARQRSDDMRFPNSCVGGKRILFIFILGFGRMGPLWWAGKQRAKGVRERLV